MPHTLDYRPALDRHGWTPFKVANLVVASLALLCYLHMFGSLGGAGAIAFFFPATMYPFVVNALLLFRWRTVTGQSLVLAASLAYAAWLAFVFIDVMYRHPDPQGPIAFLFVGIYAAPVLLVLWLVAAALEHRRRAA